MDKTQRTRTNADARIQGKAEGNGWLEGYAAVFGNVDSQGDVIRKGAFAKSIAEKVQAGKVKLMVRHVRDGGDTPEVVGVVTQAKEDDIGLWIHAEFGSDQTSQDARAKAIEGLATGLSIGYIPMQWADVMVEGKEAVELTEIKLMEVTLTAFPANEQAVVTKAKSTGPEATTPPPPPAPAQQAASTDWSSAIRRRRLALLDMED